MQGDTGPGDALHVRHWRAAVDIRCVPALFADHRKNAEGRRMSGHAGRDGSFCDRRHAVIDGETLLCDRHDDLHWSDRHGDRLARLGLLSLQVSFARGRECRPAGLCGLGFRLIIVIRISTVEKIEKALCLNLGRRDRDGDAGCSKRGAPRNKTPVLYRQIVSPNPGDILRVLP